MLDYILRRLLLMIPTLFGVLLLNFAIIQAAPGGPVEQMIAQLKGIQTNAASSMGGRQTQEIAQQAPQQNPSTYQGARGLPPEIIERIKVMYGFDKPAPERFWLMLKQYLLFDFGHSYFLDRKVTDLIVERIPVSISLGLWSIILIYLISIPLGIRKAIRHGSAFDIWSSSIIIVGYSIPSFLFAILLILVFSGGSYLDWFPLSGLTSDHFDTLSSWGKIKDYLWHITLPVTASVIGGFATLTMLTKNSFLDEINKQYVLTAYAKGLSTPQVLYRHVFRNAMLLIISGFPSAFIGVFFTSSLLIETIFSLNGLGLLGFEAIIRRDYPIVFGSLYIFTLIGLVTKLVGDILYVIIDPRIDFESRNS